MNDLKSIHHFSRGFRAILPLWLGMAPFALVYATMARSAGLSVLETQLMSVIVFAGGAQFSAAGLFGVGASGLEIILTTFLLNLRHILYGLSLGRVVPLAGLQKPLAAYFLTDEAYGVTIVEKRAPFPYLLGAELSVFFIWNACTFIGAIAGQLVPDPTRIGADFVFPLAFLALLAPLLKNRVDIGIAVFAGVTALVAGRFLSGGIAILIAGVLGSLAGAWFTRGEKEAQILLAGAEGESG
jgi:predicted branched-subunit amino acid permease